MPLLERVATLLRANVNDLIDKAEDPEKMLKQLVLDMENQLLQVKTQVAIAIADQHLLAKKKSEHDQAAEGWKSKAVLAVGKGQDDLARAALDRSLTHTRLAEGFAQQLEDQRGESDLLRATFTKLQTKLSETRSRCELLIAQRRRTRALGKATEAVQSSVAFDRRAASFQRYEAQIEGEHAANLAAHALSGGGDSVDERFALLEREEEIERLLQDLKSAHPALPDHAA
jgi:phage shock protein A